MLSGISEFSVTNLRNLLPTHLDIGAGFNVFAGPNGSGKSSLLEAVYLLSVSKSFRATNWRQYVAFGCERAVIRAKLGDKWVGFEKGLAGSNYKIANVTQASIAPITRMLPVHLVHSESDLLIDGGPSFRRQFIDSGVFHVEHSFLDSWRGLKKTLEQRNAALKARQKDLSAWDEAFIEYSTLVDAARRRFVQNFSDVFVQQMHDIIGLSGIELHYSPGWDEEQDLEIALRESSSLDLMTGFTNRGPHRADLLIKIDDKLAKDVLSRGQAKMFVCVLLLAKALLVKTEADSVFLLDDLHAELDSSACSLFVNALARYDFQVFITGIEQELLEKALDGKEYKLFHVEQGNISEGLKQSVGN